MSLGFKNTLMQFVYRDADNHLHNTTYIVSGLIDYRQIRRILKTLDHGLYFIPEAIYGHGNRPPWSGRNRQPWFELYPQGFHHTILSPKPEMAIDTFTLVKRFEEAKDQWQLWADRITPEFIKMQIWGG